MKESTWEQPTFFFLNIKQPVRGKKKKKKAEFEGILQIKGVNPKRYTANSLSFSSNMKNCTRSLFEAQANPRAAVMDTDVEEK